MDLGYWLALAVKRLCPENIKRTNQKRVEKTLGQILWDDEREATHLNDADQHEVPKREAEKNRMHMMRSMHLFLLAAFYNTYSYIIYLEMFRDHSSEPAHMWLCLVQCDREYI